MTVSLSTEGRRDGASSACASDFSRRLTIIGGFVLLGWVALAIAGATHAAASPDPSAGRHPAIASSQAPTISTMTGRSHGAAAARVLDAAGHTTAPAPAPIRSDSDGRTDAYGAAPVLLPANQTATSAPRSDAHPTRAGPAALPVDANAVLNDLPVVDGLAPAIERAVDPVLNPIESAVAPVLAPASGLLAPVGQLVTQLGTAVRPASSTVDSLLAPVTTPVDGALARVAQPVAALSAGLASGTTPPAGVPPAPPGAAPGPPAPVAGSAVGQGVSAVVPAPSGGLVSVVSPSGAGYSESTSARSASSTAPVSAASGRLDRVRLPGPLPVVPPSAPELLAIATAPGAATTSSPGSGGTSLPGFNTAESWAAQQLRHIGMADPGGSRAVRNNAHKPPVSPD